MKRNQGMSLWEVLVVIVIIVLLIGLLLPAMGSHHHGSRQMQNSTQVRGIQGAFVLFAQGNNQWYPGIRSDGEKVIDSTDTLSFPGIQHPKNKEGDRASTRLALLLNNNYFSGDYALSPAENKASVWTTGELTINQFSYALLQIDAGKSETSAGRRVEWSSNTFNSQAAVLGDKSVDLDPMMKTTSLWVTSTTSALTNPRDWRGSVGWNDNHVSFETSATLGKTKYGKLENENDNLFTHSDTSNTTANAAMVYN